MYRLRLGTRLPGDRMHLGIQMRNRMGHRRLPFPCEGAHASAHRHCATVGFFVRALAQPVSATSATVVPRARAGASGGAAGARHAPKGAQGPLAADAMTSEDRRRQRKERQQRKEREKDRTPDPWMDGFGVGAGRKELNRLMVLYGREKQVRDKAPVKAARVPCAPAGHSKMVNLSKIERIVAKLPWERRADEVGMVQREISSLEVYRNLRVSAAAELDICRIVTLREVEPNEYVLRQGDVGDSFNVSPSPTPQVCGLTVESPRHLLEDARAKHVPTPLLTLAGAFACADHHRGHS